VSLLRETGMFFHFIGRHWLPTIIAIVLWVALARKTVWYFLNENYRQTRFSFWLGERESGLVIIVLFLTIVTLCFIIAPLLIIPVRNHRKARARDAMIARDRAQLLHDREMARVESEKTARRMEWFAAHPPKLYCNTINGITAVVAPFDFVAHVEKTARMVRNEQWLHKVLPPLEETYLFVNAKGVATIDAALRQPKAGYYYSGWLADLDDLVRHYNVELVEEPRLFVPFANESILPLDQHSSSKSSLKSIASMLIDMQAPRDLWPRS
jgi:uncharacterized membrane protein